jgi:hypothetical protein
VHVRQGQSDPCRQRISTRVHVWPAPATTTAELSANQLGSAATTGASSTATAELGADEPGAATTATGTSSAATAALITGGAPFPRSRELTSRVTLRLATTSNRKAPRQAVRPAEGLERVHVYNMRGVCHDQKIASACARKFY